jgi:L-2-hydroxyglutarate oxidase LhgO
MDETHTQKRVTRLAIMENLDCVVIGAGIVGLAVARELSLSGREVVILETEQGIGMEASSRTGEVIHAGLYYKPGSLRASLCVRGKKRLYAYCRNNDVPSRRLGELVVCPEPSSVHAVKKILDQALACNVNDVSLLDGNCVREIEPELRCEMAIMSPSTGVVDSHALMQAFLRDAEEEGSILLLGTPCLSGKINSNGIEINIGGPEPLKITCQGLINSAGIHAQKMAASIDGFKAGLVPPSYLCKGSYFTISKETPFSHLIYSVPSGDTPGIHLSFDLAGQARFGPDAQWMEEVDYDVDYERGSFFEQGVRRYWPDVPAGSLNPGFAGYFARTYGPDDPVSDWIIQGPDDHGIPGLINLFGIDSPGLTACMSIAEYVKGKLNVGH